MSNPVYMVGIIDVKDFQAYAKQYGMPVGEMFAELARELYNSERYAPFKAARQQTLANQTTFAIVPALA